jgi:hypothetical protein
MIIVSQNIFDIDPHEIAKTTVVETIVGGRVVFQAKTKYAKYSPPFVGRRKFDRWGIHILRKRET